MSDTTYNEIVSDEAADAEDSSPNITRMREKIERQEAELKELRALRVEKHLREAGFDPKSDKGQALADLIDAGKVDASVDGIKQAAGRYGWTGGAPAARPPQPVIERVDDILSQSTSDNPDPDEDRDRRIAEAEAAGDINTSIALKQEKYGLKR